MWLTPGVIAIIALIGYAVYLGCARNESKTSQRLIARYGLVSLREMGYDDQLLKNADADAASKRVLEFAFPEGARQGSRDWYMLKLRYRIAISKRSGTGKIYLYAATNGRSAAMIVFSVKRRGDRIDVERSDVGVVTGNRQERSRKLIWDGTFTNYLQTAGVREGKSSLTFKYLELGRARIEYWKVFDDSGIVRTRSGPSHIEIVPSISDRRIDIGERFRVDYRVNNTNNTPVPAGGRVWLRVLSGDALVVIGSRSTSIGRMPGGGYVSGSFEIEAKKAGLIPIALEASSWAGSPRVRLAVRVRG
jgi:hypothetical protein